MNKKNISSKRIKTVGIDFDLTCVDTTFAENGWFDYLNKMSKNKLDKQKFLEYHSLGNGKIDYGNLIDYNLSVYFPDLSEQEAMSFWSDERLYQKIKPYPEAVEVINKLAKDGYNICFISHCKKMHYGSKVQAAKEWFDIPQVQFCFIATKEKHFVDINVFIDDRQAFHNLFVDKPEVIKVLFETPYTQDEELKVSIELKTNKWEDIFTLIKDLS